MRVTDMQSLYRYGLLSLLAIQLVSCKMEEIAQVESMKQIQGNWRITHATRNGTDITEKFDFSAFRITFGEDGRYHLQHPLPFIVAEDGVFSLDDPQYPYHIKFVETGNSREAISSFEYPIVAGARNLYLTFSPGCGTNTYIYTLIETND